MASRSEIISTVTVEPDAQGQFRIDAIVIGLDGELRKLRFLVDTGAAAVTIRESDLRGFAYLQEPTPGAGVVFADGRTAGSSSALIYGLAIGPIELRGQRVNVVQRLKENLLGMSSLRHLNMRVQNGRLTFMQRISPAS
jgi:clan AA aspartic protease (TIGR02281 family)